MRKSLHLHLVLALGVAAASAWPATPALAQPPILEGMALAATAPVPPPPAATPTATAAAPVPEASASTTEAAPEASATSTSEAPVPATYWDAVDDFIAKSKAPCPWLSWGADTRVRDEYSGRLNLNSNSGPASPANKKEMNWLRYRSRIWASITPVKDVTLNMRLSWEGWDDLEPVYSQRRKEVFFDTMNLNLRNIGGLPVDATLGRQDIFLGDGWLIGEGTPFDGSRTTFFDAARFTLTSKECNTTADLIFIDQGFHGNYVMPPLLTFDPRTDKAYDIEQDERAVIAWVANKSIKNTEIDGFYIYKDMVREIYGPYGGNNGHIHTFGGRLVEDFDKNWQYKAQGAHEFGELDGRELSAYGFTNKLSYFTRDDVNNNFRITYEFLSGDDPNSGTNEAWQPLWGRWPQWSELYVYTVFYTGEARIAEINNLHRLAFGWSCNPCKKLELAVDYHLLFADESVSRKDTHFVSSSNDMFRGQLITFWEKYKICDHVSGHLVEEFFFPGGYYKAPQDSVATFLRGEVVFTW
jgi:hypothetical protein